MSRLSHLPADMSLTQPPAPAAFPVEIWREIVRLATAAPDSPNAAPGKLGAGNFNWPYTFSCDEPSIQSSATRHALALTSYQFWEMTREFLYETVYIRRIEHARSLAASPALQDALARWTKHIVIAPVFADGISHAEFSPLARELGEAVVRILRCCTKLRSLVVRADTASRRLLVYDHWMKICRAVPQGVRHLDVDDDIFVSSLWEPHHLFNQKVDNFLWSLRLTAVQDERDYHFTNMTHLSLYSWPIARKWLMPALTHLSITYFPNLPRSATFWLTPRPRLELLHFGHATDLGALPEFARLLGQVAPNIHTLEYYYFGTPEMTWDPSALPASLKQVTIKTFHHPQTGHKRGQLGFDFSEGDSEPVLAPAVIERWTAFARHIAAFTVRPTILVPAGVSLDRLQVAVQPIFTACGADAHFAVSS
ncbi:hypothetical protein M0805_007595 [Coniferiporia weirii]|nr:hypothetical protein M0805_007595 [Coniferiporia weirii]